MTQTKGMQMDDFDRAWKILATDGVCDPLGSAEHQRVKAEWERCSTPSFPAAFIRCRANIGPLSD